MSDIIENRLKILDDIRDFVKNTEENVSFILKSLDWDYKHIKNVTTKRCECPYNKSHLVCSDNLEKHIASCKMKEYCCRDDKLFPENFNRNSSTVTIDAELSTLIIEQAAKNNPQFKKGIPTNSTDNRPVPLSDNQLVSLFTTDERRALYDYVVSKVGQNKQHSEEIILTENVNMNKEEQQTRTHLEDLVMLRDMKRRRTKYKVSTKSKSYTEVMREVIDNQMQSYCEWIKSSSDGEKESKSSKYRYEEDKSPEYDRRKHKKKKDHKESSPYNKRYKHKSHKSKHKKSHKSDSREK